MFKSLHSLLWFYYHISLSIQFSFVIERSKKSIKYFNWLMLIYFIQLKYAFSFWKKMGKWRQNTKIWEKTLNLPFRMNLSQPKTVYVCIVYINVFLCVFPTGFVYGFSWFVEIFGEWSILQHVPLYNLSGICFFFSISFGNHDNIIMKMFNKKW